MTRRAVKVTGGVTGVMVAWILCTVITSSVQTAQIWVSEGGGMFGKQKKKMYKWSAD